VFKAPLKRRRADLPMDNCQEPASAIEFDGQVVPTDA
jgi:hypothetical protein